MLNLIGECHSLSYDALTAHVAIVFTRYMLLATEQRLHKWSFSCLMDQYIHMSIFRRLFCNPHPFLIPTPARQSPNRYVRTCMNPCPSKGWTVPSRKGCGSARTATHRWYTWDIHLSARNSISSRQRSAGSNIIRRN